MHQSTEILTATITALTGITAGLASVAALKLARGARPRRTEPAPTAGLVATGYRYCPDELRTRAAVLHGDGTATCDGCGTTIPATEVPRA